MPKYRVYMKEIYFTPVQVEADDPEKAKDECEKLIEQQKWPVSKSLPCPVFQERAPRETWGVEIMRNIDA